MAPLILVVDDEAHVRRLVEVNLVRAGYRVATAADGEEALEKTSELSPNLIVLDWMMPRLSGMAALKRLRENPGTADIPVILLTAKADNDSVYRAWSEGVDLHLAKPFNPLELLTFVKRILDERREVEQEDGDARWAV